MGTQREIGAGAWSVRHGFGRTCSRGGTGLLVAALWLCAGADARAQDDTAAPVDTREAPQPPQPAVTADLESEPAPTHAPVLVPARSVPYRVGLGVMYALGPAMVLSALALDESAPLMYAAIPVSVLAPPIYHLALHQPALAVRAAWAGPVAIAIGGAAGALLGLAIGAAADADEGEDDSDWGILLGLVAGSSSGAGLGYLIWAAIDIATAKLEPHERAPSRERAALSLRPIIAPLVSREASGNRMSGALLGIEGRM